MRVIINLYNCISLTGYRPVGYVLACVSCIGLGFPASKQC